MGKNKEEHIDFDTFRKGIEETAWFPSQDGDVQNTLETSCIFTLTEIKQLFEHLDRTNRGWLTWGEVQTIIEDEARFMEMHAQLHDWHSHGVHGDILHDHEASLANEFLRQTLPYDCRESHVSNATTPPGTPPPRLRRRKRSKRKRLKKGGKCGSGPGKSRDEFGDECFYDERIVYKCVVTKHSKLRERKNREDYRSKEGKIRTIKQRSTLRCPGEDERKKGKKSVSNALDQHYDANLNAVQAALNASKYASSKVDESFMAIGSAAIAQADMRALQRRRSMIQTKMAIDAGCLLGSKKLHMKAANVPFIRRDRERRSRPSNKFPKQSARRAKTSHGAKHKGLSSISRDASLHTRKTQRGLHCMPNCVHEIDGFRAIPAACNRSWNKLALELRPFLDFESRRHLYEFIRNLDWDWSRENHDFGMHITPSVGMKFKKKTRNISMRKVAVDRQKPPRVEQNANMSTKMQDRPVTTFQGAGLKKKHELGGMKSKSAGNCNDQCDGVRPSSRTREKLFSLPEIRSTNLETSGVSLPSRQKSSKSFMTNKSGTGKLVNTKDKVGRRRTSRISNKQAPIRRRKKAAVTNGARLREDRLRKAYSLSLRERETIRKHRLTENSFPISKLSCDTSVAIKDGKTHRGSKKFQSSLL
jgi:hypothetical protein